MKCLYCGEQMKLSEHIPAQVTDLGMYEYHCACGASVEVIWSDPEDDLEYDDGYYEDELRAERDVEEADDRYHALKDEGRLDR